MKAKQWLIVLACAFGMLALLANMKVEAAEANSWGIDAINDYIDKANVLVGDEAGDFCSGTVISIKNRFILTADHCVQDRVGREEREFVDPITGEVTRKTIEKRLELLVSKRIVKDYEVVSRQSFTARIWARDAEHDVAILQIIDKDYAPTYAASLAAENYRLKRGETIYVVGNPGIELDNSVTKGIVSATERTLDFGGGKTLKVFQIDAVAIGGNSGGSVLNEQGQIVGTLDAGLRGAGINFVVPVSATRQLLKDKGFRDADGPGIVTEGPTKIDEKSASPLTPRVYSPELDDLMAGAARSWIARFHRMIGQVAP